MIKRKKKNIGKRAQKVYKPECQQKKFFSSVKYFFFGGGGCGVISITKVDIFC